MREKRIHNVHRINFKQYRNEAHFLQFQNLHSFNLATFFLMNRMRRKDE